jgi:hypothetical protein
MSSTCEPLLGFHQVIHVDADVMETGAAALKVVAVQSDAGNRLDEFNSCESRKGDSDSNTVLRAAACERARSFVYFEHAKCAPRLAAYASNAGWSSGTRTAI